MINGYFYILTTPAISSKRKFEYEWDDKNVCGVVKCVCLPKGIFGLVLTKYSWMFALAHQLRLLPITLTTIDMLCCWLMNESAVVFCDSRWNNNATAWRGIEIITTFQLYMLENNNHLSPLILISHILTYCFQDCLNGCLEVGSSDQSVPYPRIYFPLLRRLVKL